MEEKPTQEEAEKIINEEEKPEGTNILYECIVEKPQKKKYKFTYDPKSFTPKEEEQTE